MDIPTPAHMHQSLLHQDRGGYFPDSEGAKAYSERIKKTAYHQDRLRSLKFLTNGLNVTNKHVVDFGIGDGGILKALIKRPSKIFGIDASPHMIQIARKNFPTKKFSGLVGSVECLSPLAENSIDLFFCINTLGYLEERDRDTLFLQVYRTLKTGGAFVLTTGNVLFDLFALNSGTIDFFSEQFGVLGVDKLLTQGKASRFKNANRLNPLSLNHILAKYGLTELRQSFASYHKQPPAFFLSDSQQEDLSALRLKARSLEIDANALNDLDRWQALFRCSIFSSLSIKI